MFVLECGAQSRAQETEQATVSEPLELTASRLCQIMTPQENIDQPPLLAFEHLEQLRVTTSLASCPVQGLENCVICCIIAPPPKFRNPLTGSLAQGGPVLHKMLDPFCPDGGATWRASRAYEEGQNIARSEQGHSLDPFFYPSLHTQGDVLERFVLKAVQELFVCLCSQALLLESVKFLVHENCVRHIGLVLVQAAQIRKQLMGSLAHGGRVLHQMLDQFCPDGASHVCEERNISIESYLYRIALHRTIEQF